MPVDVTIRIGGQAGQGIQMISNVLGRSLVRGGYYCFTSQDVMSRIRGGHNFSDVRLSDRPVCAHHESVDLLLALDERTINEHQAQMVAGGVIVYDPKQTKPAAEKRTLFAVPLSEIATRVGKDLRMANSVALGTMFCLTGYPLDPLLDALRTQFTDKGPDILRANLACARAGYEFAQKDFKKTCPCKLPELGGPVSRLFMSGAEAVGLSAMLSGLQFYSGYPMSPSTPILEYVAARAKEHGVIVEQAEDEISAINMALGASVAGARAMTASAGGGFSLMVESLSLAGMTETPIVIAVCSRPGPATGLATRHAQADLMFALHAGHGEFNRVLFAPGTAEQAIDQVSRAFDLAERFQVPAIVLLDQHFNDSYWTVESLDESRLKYDRYITDGAGLPPYTYKRYAPPAPSGNLQSSIPNLQSAVSSPAVSPLLRPGSPNQVRYDDSDEHTEEGHITESAEVRRAMVTKRLGKAAAIGMELTQPECCPDEKARVVALCFGSTYGVVREAVERLRDQNASVTLMHLSELSPFPRQSVLARLAKTPKVVTIECNATGQLARLVTTETHLKIHDSILKYDGRPFRIEEVTAELEKQL